MATKRYSPRVLAAAYEALVTSFHFKGDVASFLVKCGVSADLLVKHQLANNGPPKRVSTRAILDDLAADPLTGTPIIRSIIAALVDQNLDFPQLSKSGDPEESVQQARRAVAALKEIAREEGAADRTADARRASIARSQEEAQQTRRRTEMLEQLKERFVSMSSTNDERGRGRAFDHWLRDLFDHFDLSPRRPYRPQGEEIDGAIVLSGSHLLVEAKWLNKPVETSDIGVFRQKIDDKLKTTMGLFISMSGFSINAIEKASNAGSMILMDGPELMSVLEGHADLVDLLEKKLRRAHETGEALFKALS